MKHTFRIRAVDNSGNVDPTPAWISWTVNADSTTSGTQSSNTIPSDYPAENNDEDDEGNSGGSFPMLVVYIVVPVVGVLTPAGLLVLCKLASISRGVSRVHQAP